MDSKTFVPFSDTSCETVMIMFYTPMRRSFQRAGIKRFQMRRGTEAQDILTWRKPSNCIDFLSDEAFTLIALNPLRH